HHHPYARQAAVTNQTILRHQSYDTYHQQQHARQDPVTKQKIARHWSYDPYHYYPSESISVSSCLPLHSMWLPENPKSLTVDRSGLSFMSETSNFPYFGLVPSTLCANPIIQSPVTTSDPSVDYSPSQTEDFPNSIIQSPITTSDPSVEHSLLQTEDLTWNCNISNHQHSETYSNFPSFGSSPVTTSDPSVDSCLSQTENFPNSIIQSPVTTSDLSVYS
ncbi:8144_t:CDS:2, partial [Ambispora gerdemannii]